jgi:4-amino-4-deoxy-L-arabinose transferase-like glycosyltransferase
MSAGIVWLTWLLARDLTNSKAVAHSAVILLLGMEMFCAAAVEIRPDVPQVLFGMLGMWATLRGGRDGRESLSCLGGASLALSFVFLQKALVVIVLVLAAQGLAVWQGRLRAQHLVLHLAALLLVLAPFGLHLWLGDGLSAYLFWNWTLNLHFSCPQTDWFFLRQSLLLNAPTWALFAAGLWLAVGRKIQILVLAGGLAVAMLASVAVYNVHYPQYFLHFFPLMAPLAAFGLHKIARRREVLAAVLVLACLGSMGKYVFELVARGNAEQLAKVAYVLNGTEKTDAIYDGNSQFNLFRPDVDYFWFSVRPGCSGLAAYQDVKGYEYDITERILRVRPRLVSTYLLDVGAAGLDGYRPSAVYPDLLWRVEDSKSPAFPAAP